MDRGVVFTFESVLAFTLVIAFSSLFYVSMINIAPTHHSYQLYYLENLAMDIGHLQEFYNNTTTPEDIGFCSTGNITASSTILVYGNTSLNNSTWLQSDVNNHTYNVSLCYSPVPEKSVSIRLIEVPYVVQNETDVMINVSVRNQQSDMDLSVIFNSTLLDEIQTKNVLYGSVVTYNFTVTPPQEGVCYVFNLTLNSSSVLDIASESFCTKERVLTRAVTIPEYPSPLIPLIFVVIIVMVGVKYG
jgi:hypothetical protein